MDDARPSLGAVLSGWIASQRLHPAHIERYTGITRAHLWLMTSGRVTRPTPETLRKLALALATDLRTGELDVARRDAALRDLSDAAGVPAPVDGLAMGDLRALLEPLRDAVEVQALFDAQVAEQSLPRQRDEQPVRVWVTVGLLRRLGPILAGDSTPEPEEEYS